MSIIDEISRLVIKRLTMSKEIFGLSGSTLPSTTRPGVVSNQRLTRLPSASSPSQRYLILLCRSIAFTFSAWSISAMLLNSMPSPGPPSRMTER